MRDFVTLELPNVDLTQITRISIAFPVSEKLVINKMGLSLGTEPVQDSFIKDYDSLSGNCPKNWGIAFDLSHWRQFLALDDGDPIGSILLAFDTEGIHMLDGRDDLAIIWDLRVAPNARGRGIGSTLFEAAKAWSWQQGCTEMKVETQDINVAACRFYASKGFQLSEANAGAYPQCPDETQLIWVKSLIPAPR